MRSIVILLLMILFSAVLFGQQDTVFIRYNKSMPDDELSYTTDTVIFLSEMRRHILTGTTVLPSTSSQQTAKGYGLYLISVAKSDCMSHGEEVYNSDDKINSIVATDTSLTVDINIYDNCCFDFLCDVSVDSLGVVNLIYYGYGTYCACDCCFGLVYNFLRTESFAGELTAIMINNDSKTLKSFK